MRFNAFTSSPAVGTEGVQRKSVCYARSGDNMARAEKVKLTVSPC